MDKKEIRFVCLTVVVSILGVGLLPASGSDLYVDPVNGSDANSGLSWPSALKTITRAAELAGRTYPVIYLSEGVFSAESGEVFPLSFYYPVRLFGASPETTIIDAGSSATIMDNLNWVGFPYYYGECALSNLTIRALGQPMGPGDEDAMLTARGSLEMQSVDLLGLSSATRPILAVSCGAGLSLTDCRFIGCDAEWLRGLPDDDHDGLNWLTMTRCVFDGRFPIKETTCVYVGDAGIYDCRFIGAGADSGIGFYGENYIYSYIYSDIFNCSFENFYVGFGCSWEHEIYGCSFRNSRVYNIGQEQDYWYCVFDQSCYFYVEGWADVRWSCFPIVAQLDRGGMYFAEPVIRDDPMFVKGPLGACYLSNQASGQQFSSPCLSFTYGSYYPSWPPSGSTTRTDGAPDEGPYYDMGYHYPSVPPPPPAVSVRTDRTEYAVGDEMQAFMTYENRGVKIEGAIYFAFGPDSLDWLIFWPWMTFVPTPWVWGTLWSGVSHQNLPPTTHTIPDGLAPGHYLWLGAVLASDGAFASDIALWPVTITAD